MRLIDAEAIKYESEIYPLGNGKYMDIEVTYRDWINAMPTMEALPVRHGKWLYGESESGHDGYFCSQCGKHIRWIYGEEDINFIRSYNYCPNCGARMSGDD